jgi:nucleoside-diphosphate-sugar epimerase
VKRFVYASSSSIYGNAPVLQVTEETLPQLVWPYGVTRLAAGYLCMLYWHNYRVPVVALRDGLAAEIAFLRGSLY